MLRKPRLKKARKEAFVNAKAIVIKMQRTGCFSFILAVIMIFTCLTAASCGEKAPSYSAELSAAELAASADKVLTDSEKYAEVPESYINGRMGIDVADFESYIIKINVIDEYGIFKISAGGDTNAAKEAVEDYLARRVDEWMPEYMPEEFPKVENASVKVMGQYVIYCILADDAKTDVFEAVENTLLEK